MDKVTDPSQANANLPPLPQASSSRRTPAQRANDANPQKEGPHRKVKKEVAADAEPQPPYIVAVKKKDDSSDEALKDATKAPMRYDAKELKAKARSLLANDRIPIEQRRVLKEILGPEDKDK